MTELRSESGRAEATTQGDDPVGRLHKMSTTAGLGSQDYVAINAPSVAALFLGLASSLAVLDNVLLVIPAVAVVMAIVSIRQIANSGGTQTGRLLAWTGMVLAIGISTVLLVRQQIEIARTKADEAQIASMVSRLGEEVLNQKWDEAYAEFTTEFQSRVKKEAFIDQMRLLRSAPLYGKLVSMSSGGQMSFQTMPMVQGMVSFTFDKSPDPLRQAFVFRLQDGHWRVNDIPSMFSRPTQR